MSAGGYRTGWESVVDWVTHLGVDTVFGLPSDDLELLAALEPHTVRMVLCRDQRNAMFMSAGYALASGRPGICVVGKGPAVTNAVTGLLEARSGGAPVVLLATGTAAPRRGTGAFQELDQLSVVRPVVKWATRVDDPARLGAVLQRAAFVAVNDAPGPVYVEIPEDLGAAPVPGPVHWRPLTIQRPDPDPDALAEAVTAIRRAARPLLLVGGGARHRNADAAIERLARAIGAGIFATASGRGAVDETDPLFCGLAGLYAVAPLADLWSRTDLVVALGSRLEETATFGWQRLPAGTPILQVNLAHADVAVERPGAVVFADVARTVAALLTAMAQHPVDRSGWVTEVGEARQRAWWAVDERLKELSAGPRLHVAEVLAALAQVVPAERVLVQENGLQDMWSYFYPHYVSSVDGSVVPSEQTSLGFGAAAAVGVRLAQPTRPVVALVGDGAFNLFRSDLGTAADVGAAVMYLVLDNGGYGWLQSQLDHRPGASRFRFTRDPRDRRNGDGRAVTPVTHPDVWSERVIDRADLLPALRSAAARCARGTPAVVVIPVDLADVAPGLAELAGDFPVAPVAD